jgi:hypothetical protein
MELDLVWVEEQAGGSAGGGAGAWRSIGSLAGLVLLTLGAYRLWRQRRGLI